MNGGPAFPVSTDTTWGKSGMSLRDYFAAKAMEKLLPNLEDFGRLAESGKEDYSEIISIVAKSAYTVADAMLTARGVE